MLDWAYPFIRAMGWFCYLKVFMRVLVSPWYPLYAEGIGLYIFTIFAFWRLTGVGLK